MERRRIVIKGTCWSGAQPAAAKGAPAEGKVPAAAPAPVPAVQVRRPAKRGAPSSKAGDLDALPRKDPADR